MALRSLGFVTVDEAVDGQHAVDMSRGRQYDVVVLDIRMPRVNGVEACRRLKGVASASSPPVVIVLSTFDEPAIRVAAREAGAALVLGKETEPRLLATWIDRLLQGPAPDTDVEVALPDLTPRERDVLRLAVDAASNKEMAAALGISVETVKDHLARLYAKLGVRDRVGALQAARRAGWLLLNEIDDDGT